MLVKAMDVYGHETWINAGQIRFLAYYKDDETRVQFDAGNMVNVKQAIGSLAVAVQQALR